VSKPPPEWFAEYEATERDWELATAFVNSAQDNPPDGVAEVSLTALLAQVRKEERLRCLPPARPRSPSAFELQAAAVKRSPSGAMAAVREVTLEDYDRIDPPKAGP
jgi:hypothetical protein